eukprot:g2402.t1
MVQKGKKLRAEAPVFSPPVVCSNKVLSPSKNSNENVIVSNNYAGPKCNFNSVISRTSPKLRWRVKAKSTGDKKKENLGQLANMNNRNGCTRQIKRVTDLPFLEDICGDDALGSVVPIMVEKETSLDVHEGSDCAVSVKNTSTLVKDGEINCNDEKDLVRTYRYKKKELTRPERLLVDSEEKDESVVVVESEKELLKDGKKKEVDVEEDSLKMNDALHGTPCTTPLIEAQASPSSETLPTLPLSRKIQPLNNEVSTPVSVTRNNCSRHHYQKTTQHPNGRLMSLHGFGPMNASHSGQHIRAYSASPALLRRGRRTNSSYISSPYGHRGPSRNSDMQSFSSLSMSFSHGLNGPHGSKQTHHCRPSPRPPVHRRRSDSQSGVSRGRQGRRARTGSMSSACSSCVEGGGWNNRTNCSLSSVSPNKSVNTSIGGNCSYLNASLDSFGDIEIEDDRESMNYNTGADRLRRSAPFEFGRIGKDVDFDEFSDCENLAAENGWDSPKLKSSSNDIVFGELESMENGKWDQQQQITQELEFGIEVSEAQRELQARELSEALAARSRLALGGETSSQNLSLECSSEEDGNERLKLKASNAENIRLKKELEAKNKQLKASEAENVRLRQELELERLRSALKLERQAKDAMARKVTELQQAHANECERVAHLTKLQQQQKGQNVAYDGGIQIPQIHSENDIWNLNSLPQKKSPAAITVKTSTDVSDEEAVLPRAFLEEIGTANRIDMKENNET